MAICGYNDKIGEGLRLLVEGMVDALERKAATASADEVLATELRELDAMISTLGTAEGETLPQMFVGLNVFASALFSDVQRQLLSSGSGDLSAPCRRVGEDFVDLLIETEGKSQELRSSDYEKRSASVFAKTLAEWSLRKSRSYGAASFQLVTTT